MPPEILGDALKFINANLDSKLDWEQMADAVGMSPFAFGRGFKQSIADVALDVGCSCQSHLATMFRKHTGTTPGRFRRRSAKEPT